jgi:hypothetical protein
MGDHHDGLAGAMLVIEQIEHALRRLRVERTGRLVGEEEHRPVGERAADGDALLLAARQRAGHGVGLVGHAECVEELDRACLRRLATGADELLWQVDVGSDVQVRYQAVLLEDVAHLLASEDGPGGNRERGHVAVGDDDGAAVGVVESTEEVEQRRRATAARAHDGDPFARSTAIDTPRSTDCCVCPLRQDFTRSRACEECCHHFVVLPPGAPHRAERPRTAAAILAHEHQRSNRRPEASALSRNA